MFEYKEQIRRRLTEYASFITREDRKAGQRMYICPLCGSGKGVGSGSADGAFSITPDGLQWHCFSCGKGGDIFDLIGEQMALRTFPEQYRYAIEFFEYKEEDSQARASTAQEDFADIDQQDAHDAAITGREDASEMEAKDIQDYISHCIGSMPDSIGFFYLLSRGLSEETIRDLQLGYDCDKDAIVIPYPGEDYYVSRSISEKEYRKLKGVAEPLYHIQKKEGILGDDPVFITEGQIDAASLYQAGATNVIALGGTGYHKLKSIDLPRKVIYVADNDDAGREAARKVKEALKSTQYFTIVVPPERFKDSNDALKADSEILKSLVNDWKRAMALKTASDNVTEYITSAFGAEIADFRSYKDRKTGYKQLDKEIECLYPGLYVLGAISSLGKTTFAHQMADQLVEQGDYVIYFSMEQSRMEMVSKGIARTMAKKYLKEGSAPERTDIKQYTASAIEIRRGVDSVKKEAVEEAIKEYAEKSSRFYIVQCDFETNVNTITDYVEQFVAEKHVRPVVFVDYLQIIRPLDSRMSVKDAVDSHVRALKMLQRNNDLVVIVISSLNRSNYIAPIDYESFKETGGIEYTADVVWGLQLSIMNNTVFNTSQELIKKREIVKVAKAEIPRKLQLVCLKNRYGKSYYECDFDYYPEHDLFVSVLSDFSKQPEKVNDLINSLGKTRGGTPKAGKKEEKGVFED